MVYYTTFVVGILHSSITAYEMKHTKVMKLRQISKIMFLLGIWKKFFILKALTIIEFWAWFSFPKSQKLLFCILHLLYTMLQKTTNAVSSGFPILFNLWKFYWLLTFIMECEISLKICLSIPLKLGEIRTKNNGNLK